MGKFSVKDKKLLYHLTKFSNFSSIIEKGLLSRKALLSLKCNFSDVADESIIEKRTLYNLDTFIPFHFYPRTPFDAAVKNAYADDDFIYICIYRDLAREENFKVLPKHPLSEGECQLYSYDEGFNKIEWDILEKKGVGNPHEKCVKMAECLSPRPIYLQDMQKIIVPNQSVKEKIEKLLSNSYNIIYPPPYINIEKLF